jgi:hypothetical protein
MRKTLKLYYSETEIIEDILEWFRSSPEVSVKMVSDSDAFLRAQRAKILARMIRNEYGLWDIRNPYTVVLYPILSGDVITDPRHPDNLSGFVVKEVLARLAAEVEKKGGWTGVPVHTAGDQKWN